MKRPLRLSALVLLSLLTFGASARASGAAVAVMPFRDLSGGKGSIGEAIRETVTTDLKEVSGMKVIERANLDKVLSEQNLQTKKDDLDPLSTVKVGKLVGATLIVAGAYQKAGTNVRLTARFVSVESGEIVGTAKVDGAQSDFLTLQDRVTTQLLKSAGIEAKHVQTFAARKRPKVKSIRTIELYGDAVVETDDAKKRALLEEAVKIDPGFVYASRDLDALEQRMRGYVAVAEETQTKQTKEDLAKIESELKTEKDPLKIYIYYTQLFSRLLMTQRYRTLIVVCKRVIANPPPTPPQVAAAGSLEEMAQMWLVRSYEQLKEDDNMLREGEKFLVKYPGSTQIMGMQMLLNAAIERKRQSQEGGGKARDEIANLPPQFRNDPCRTGPIYNSNNQRSEAIKALEVCYQRGGDPRMPWMAPFLLVFANYQSGRYAETKKWIGVLREKYPDHYRDVKQLEAMVPHEE